MGAKPTRDGGCVGRNSFSHASSPQSFSRRFGRIGDNYRTLDQVREALAESGLESSNLIVGIDFTKSNEWTGRNSFDGRCLHHLSEGEEGVFNPYQHAISIIGRTLSRFDEDNLIPCFGFGDVTTHDRDVFSFYPDSRSCNGFEEALSRYREIVPHVRLAGPTSFAPIIETAIGIVDQSGGQYHVLLIIADGQVTRSVDTGAGQLSPQEQNTVNAIVRASDYPLSIVVVGVGDGPWDMMREFDDNIPARAFDNIQFVNFTEIMSRNIPLPQKEAEFALAALMEIPLQYRATLELQLLGNERGHSTTVPLPPPSRILRSNSYLTPPPRNLRSLSLSSSFSENYSTNYPPSPVSTSSTSNERKCPVCFYSKRNLALGCGHQTCHDCGEELTWCPICRAEITARIKLYD
ncbi:Copine phospholipid-binding family [Perilla frutescens var. hirtella]|uniref:Copine phospholipid-binding family n=1 Tax=Perilla frutescens var. hirtella TaxID=608512 RepID=A0AAD4JGT2_PERFH|nr:Copine phospholipid-binding family [Perilla frutescens var. frutescens]KAH6787810.1 Copine phospholipid-binding family [Perilla frutescens var. hirtella]KAH6833563.1 Copine phospholipid-binding family [Perilla frutescens var. hirtella]